jgi:hypothetical protein
MTELLVRPKAELGTFEAALWYGGKRAGLGAAFCKRCEEYSSALASRPCSSLSSRTMCGALLGCFPFGVFFLLEDERAARRDGSSSVKDLKNFESEHRIARVRRPASLPAHLPSRGDCRSKRR